jgi:hypothetical protein
VGHPVPGDALDHAGHAEAVVAVEVGDAQPVDAVHRHPGVQHLPLGPLAGIEQETGPVPAQQVPVVVAQAGGNRARGAEDDEFTDRHERDGIRGR